MGQAGAAAGASRVEIVDAKEISPPVSPGNTDLPI